MNNFDLKSMRRIAVLILICFIFVMVIWHAFEYLPSPEVNNAGADSILTLQEEENNKPAVSEEEKVSAENSKEKRSEEANIPAKPEITEHSYDQPGLIPLENIDTDINDENISSGLSPEGALKTAIDTAEKYLKEKQYAKAAVGYEKAASMTDEVLVKADCYEKIAIIYAVLKRYGSALSFAQKAYNLSPSTQREVLLARLYYKTGDIDKATKRINNVLQRDFSDDK